MQTRNIDLTNQWTLITTGPASYLSFESCKSGKNGSIQVAISSGLPADGITGHLVTGLMGAELDAGENLYAKSSGQYALMIITDKPAVALKPPAAIPPAPPIAQPNEPRKNIVPEKVKVVPEIPKKPGGKQGDQNG